MSDAPDPRKALQAALYAAICQAVDAAIARGLPPPNALDAVAAATGALCGHLDVLEVPEKMTDDLVAKAMDAARKHVRFVRAPVQGRA